ncbi:MAG: hypothetical protein Q6363_009310 [Candidatus Njordarchaeota archaeon]
MDTIILAPFIHKKGKKLNNTEFLRMIMMNKEELVKKVIEQKVDKKSLMLLVSLYRSNQIEKLSFMLRKMFLDIFNKACEILGIFRLKVDILAGDSCKHSIFYDKDNFRVVVIIGRFLETCEVYEKCIGLSFSDVLTYMTLHEIGHHQLNLIEVAPKNNVDSARYFVIYSMFEDYIISRYLRGDIYRELEKKIIKFEATQACRKLDIKILRDRSFWKAGHVMRAFVARWVDQIALIGLAVALNYIDQKDLDLPENIKNLILLIADSMEKITEDKIKKAPNIAYDAWLEYLAYL